jgi:hypothetical protein
MKWIGIANVVSFVDPQVDSGWWRGSNCGWLPRIREVVQSWAQPIAENLCNCSLTLARQQV